MGARNGQPPAVGAALGRRRRRPRLHRIRRPPRRHPQRRTRRARLGVVSGAAYGVDGAAHRGALAADGATIAVLASGVDYAYPRGHTELIGRISEQGLVVAELPPGDHPTRTRFVQRNRVIAALTRGTVVVEAELRSGSLVTARRALALGRFTMGMPGPVTSGLSAGVHQLLRGEAAVVTDADEVIELVGSIGDLAPERPGSTRIRDLLDPVATRVLEALPARGSTDTTHLAQEAGTPRDVTQGKLFELQSLGFVQRCGDRWELARRAEATDGSRRAVLDLGRTGERVRGMTAESRFAVLRRTGPTRGETAMWRNGRTGSHPTRHGVRPHGPPETGTRHRVRVSPRRTR